MIKYLRQFAKRQNETLDVDAVDVRLPLLSPAQDGYRVAVVSDLHIPTLAPYHRAIIDALAHQRPDCILILGDTIDKASGPVHEMAPFFEMLSAIAPSVAILGNNDCLVGRIHALRMMYRESSVTLLENETRLISAHGLPLQITGLMDPRAARVGIEPAHAAYRHQYVPLNQTISPQTEGGGGAQTPSLLLIHRPEMALEYDVLSPSLMIAGHAHGGQFRIPHIGGLYAPGQGLFPRYTSGLYPLPHSQLYVSRGLGNHEFPLRLGNPPHLPILTLRSLQA